MKRIITALFILTFLVSCDPFISYYNIVSRLEYRFFVREKNIKNLKRFIEKYPTAAITGYLKLDLDWVIREHNRVYLASKTMQKKIVVYVDYTAGGKRDPIAEDIIYRAFIDEIKPFVKKTNLEIFRIENLPFNLSQGDMFVYLDFSKVKNKVPFKMYVYFPKLSFDSKPYYFKEYTFRPVGDDYKNLILQLKKKPVWFKIKTMLYVMSGRFETVLPDVLLDFSDFDFTRFVVETGDPWLIDAIIKTGDEDLITHTLYRYMDRVAVQESMFYYFYRWDGIDFLLERPYLFLALSDARKDKLSPLVLRAVLSKEKPVLFPEILYYIDIRGITPEEKRLLREIYERYRVYDSPAYKLQARMIKNIIEQKKIFPLK